MSLLDTNDPISLLWHFVHKHCSWLSRHDQEDVLGEAALRICERESSGKYEKLTDYIVIDAMRKITRYDYKTATRREEVPTEEVDFAVMPDVYVFESLIEAEENARQLEEYYALPQGERAHRRSEGMNSVTLYPHHQPWEKE